MLRKILIAAAGLVAVLFAVIALQPAAYSVTRSASINAPPAEVYGLISDFHKWEGWSPWTKLDPAIKTTFDGPVAAPGSIYKWAGNDQAGEGQMTILEATPPGAVKIKLDFVKPFASTSTTLFRIEGDGAASKVTWTMSGDNNFLSKAFCLFMGGMDRMVGPDFEKGLAQMKALLEKK